MHCPIWTHSVDRGPLCSTMKLSFICLDVGLFVLNRQDIIPETESHEYPPGWPIPKLQNFVVTVNLDCRIDLNYLAQRARNVEYRPRRFNAVIMRIRDPRTTALIFATGRMVVTGAKSEALARLAAKKHAYALQKCGFTPKFCDFTVQNIIASANVGSNIRLEGLANKYVTVGASFVPEIFPGLSFKQYLGYRADGTPRSCPTLLIFTTGKIVVTGAKTEEDLMAAFARVYPLFFDFRFASDPNSKTKV
ncbi:hypothetical protein QC764_607640 [Podospora pseudoanserina]|uniref:TATA-box-binding protein n=1 Tax=Podospora pseudoanserina TaxID=2609844 RepID=A0ABR0HU44_9PEZI|nr:hypothetical protein QC764_607640 [Podospora pseudoanserina]